MKVYTVAIHSQWNGKAIVSVHMTRKGAWQVACAEMLEIMIGYDTYEDETLTWIEDNLATLHNPDYTFTIAELEGIFEYAEKLFWEIENEVEVMWHTLQP